MRLPLKFFWVACQHHPVECGDALVLRDREGGFSVRWQFVQPTLYDLFSGSLDGSVKCADGKVRERSYLLYLSNTCHQGGGRGGGRRIGKFTQVCHVLPTLPSRIHLQAQLGGYPSKLSWGPQQAELGIELPPSQYRLLDKVISKIDYTKRRGERSCVPACEITHPAPLTW